MKQPKHVLYDDKKKDYMGDCLQKSVLFQRHENLRENVSRMKSNVNQTSQLLKNNNATQRCRILSNLMMEPGWCRI